MEKKKICTFKAYVTSFKDPHIFWIIKQSDIAVRDLIKKNLQLALKQPTKTAPELEKHVAIFHGAWKRAIVKDIRCNKCICWLQDYGILIETAEDVYDLPKNIRIKPSLVKQACLQNVVGLKENLSAESFCIEYSPCEQFSFGAVLKMRETLNNAVDITIDCKSISDEIYFVDVLIEDETGQCHNIKDIMFKENYAIENEEIFEGIKSTLKLNNIALIDIFKDQSVTHIKPTALFKTTNCDMRGRRLKTKEIVSEGPDKYSSTSDDCLSSISENDHDTSTEKESSVLESDSATSGNNNTSSKLVTEEETTDFTDNHSFSAGEKIKALNIMPIETQGTNKKKENNNNKNHNKNNKSKNWIDRNKFTRYDEKTNISSTELKNVSYKSESKIELNSSKSENENGNVGSSDKQQDTKKELEQSGSENKECLNNPLGYFPVHDCNCLNCVKWAPDKTSWFDDEISYKNEEVKHTASSSKIVKPSPFLRKQSECSHYSVETCQPRSLLEQEYLPSVLIHGFPIPEPRRYISEVCFHPQIRRALSKLNFERSKDLQSYTWPAILSNFNVCAVGGPKSGKTMMYLPCIASILIENMDIHKKFPSKKGPAIVIVCSDMKNAGKVFSILNYLLAKSRCNVAISVTPFDKECLQQFKNGCDVLVTTPLSLKFLLSNHIIDLKRLCHIVFDDFDKILDNYSVEINELLEHIQSMIDHRVCEVCVQYIITAEFWTPKLENILKKFHSPPLICIKAYLEAAVYGKINFKIELLPENIKESKLLSLLKDSSRLLKTIVISDEDNEIKKITDCLEIDGVSALGLTSDATRLEINEYEKMWKNADYGKYPVLVCTDKMFDNSSIRSADVLIHYSLPDLWSEFTTRHKVFLDKYLSPLVDHSENEITRCKSVVFVDGRCANKIVRFVTFLQKMGVNNLPPEYIQYNKEQILAEERNKCANKVPLCNKLKLFGKCFKTKCSKRHIYCKELDVNEELPQKGPIKFKILTVHDPVHYTVRLIGDTNVSNNFKEGLLRAARKRKNYIDKINVGDHLLYFDEPNNFCDRCQVLKILKSDGITKLASLLKIKLFDSGETKDVEESCLFELPAEFKQLPSQCVDIYVANVVPPLEELWFNYHSVNIIKKQVRDYIDEIFTGTVLLQLDNNTLWVEKVQTTEYLPRTGVTISRFSLSKFIIEKKLVVSTPKPLSLLYQLCGKETENSLTQKVKESTSKGCYFNESKYKKHWAFLPKLVYEDVILTHVVNPGYFFVSLEKFHKLLVNLEKSMKQTVTSPLYRKLDGALRSGCYYIAKMPDEDKYCRVKIVKHKSDMAYCLFLDYGQKLRVNLADIFPISENMISQLPFQAIECRLFGITPVDSWNQTHGRYIWEYCRNSDGSMKKLQAVMVDIGNNGLEAGGLKYSILLGTSQDDIILNKLLIENGTAEILDSEDYDIIIDDSKGNETVSCSSELSDSDFDYYDAELEKIKPQVPENSKTTWTEKDFIPIKAGPSCDYYTPTVYWYNTKSSVKLKIQLSCVKDYECKVIRSRIFNFSTTCSGKTYKLSFSLFKKVKKVSSHVAKETCIEIILEKQESEEWPRLLVFDDVLKKHIHYDPSYLAEDEDEGENLWENIKKFKAKVKEALGSDEEESDGFINDFYDSESDLSSISDEMLSD